MIKNDDVSFEGGKSNLPDGWKWVKLGDVCQTTSGGTPSRAVPSYYGGDIPWVKSGDLNDGLIYETEESITQEAITNSSAKKFPAGTLLVAMYGATVGKLGILAIEAATNQAVCGIFCDELLIDRNYLFYYIRQQRKKLIESSFGGAQPNISQDIIRAVKILLPSLDEQKRIAGILNEKMEAVEKARESAIAQLEAAKALTAAYLRSVFNSPEAQTWEIKTLEEVCESSQYGTSEASNDQDDGLPVLRMGNISEGRIIWQNLKYINLSETEKNKYKLKKGDILFNRTNSAELVGKTAVFDGSHDAVFASYLIRFRVVPGLVSPDYIALFINSLWGRKFIESKMTRAIGQVNISASTMQKMPIPIPAFSRQQDIVSKLTEKLTEVEKLCKALEEQLETINKLPAAFLRQAFNGEL